jgi:hypothetical protein
MMDAGAAADHAAIIKVFQKSLMSASSEEAVIGAVLPKMASMQVDSNAAASNLENAVNPPIPQEVSAVLAAANEGVEVPKIELPNELFGGAVDQALGVANWQEYLEQCIPCSQRVILRAGLVDLLSDTLLATLEQMINNFLKELAFVMNLLNAPDVYQDACLLLKALNEVCIPDLQRMLSLFAALLYKMTAEELAQFDLMKLIVTPIFQPIFIGIATLFGQFKGLICDPLECVVTQLDLQIEKLKVGAFLHSPGVRNTADALTDADIALQNLAFGEGDSAQEVNDSLAAAQQATGEWDDGLTAIQNSMGSSLMELRNLTFGGVREVQSKAEELVSEIQKFVGDSDGETLEFMLRQYKKIRLIRMIGFVSALVKALIGGFNCDLDGPDAAQHTLAQFFDNFLGPDAPVIVQVDPDTNDIELYFDRTVLQPLQSAQGAASGTPTDTQPPLVIEPTGDSEVDAAVNAIITQALQPVTVKPKCFFETSGSDSDKLQEFISQLDATEV